MKEKKKIVSSGGAKGEEGGVKFYVDFMLWDRFYAVDPHRIEAASKSRGSPGCC